MKLFNGFKLILVVAPSERIFHAIARETLHDQIIPSHPRGRNSVFTEQYEYRYISRPERMRGLHGVADVQFWGDMTRFKPMDRDLFHEYAKWAVMP